MASHISAKVGLEAPLRIYSGEKTEGCMPMTAMTIETMFYIHY